jgi:hypothetical protein
VSDIAGALAALSLWIVPQPVKAAPRRCRDYHVRDLTGNALLTVRAYLWGRDIDAHDAHARQPVLRVRRRHLFPITGVADASALAGDRQLGTVHRSGRIRDAGGRPLGRFRDARSTGQRTRESLLQGVFEAVLGGDGTTTLASGPDGYVWASPEHVVLGTLRRGAPGAPRGSWLLERSPETFGYDPLLVTAAALFMVELARY